MLPLSELSFCYAEKLSVGAFAYLADHDDAPVLIGTMNGEPSAIFLSAASDKIGVGAVRELRGMAVSIPGIEIEVEPGSTADYQLTPEHAKCLCVRRDRRVVLALSGRGLVPVDVGELDPPMPDPIAKVFLNWRIVKRIGDDCHVLFEHRAGGGNVP